MKKSKDSTMLVWDYEYVENEEEHQAITGTRQGISGKNLDEVLSLEPSVYMQDDFSRKCISRQKEFVQNRVDTSVIKKNLKAYLSELQGVFDEIAAGSDCSEGFAVDEIEVHLIVNGSGSVGLVGKIEAGMEAGIKVKFKYKK